MSLGSLTTIFFPAPTCISPDRYWLEERDGQSYVQQGPPLTQASDCFPCGFTPVPASYYSPGVCPSGYTAACLITLSGDGGKIKQNICYSNVGEYFCASESATEYSGQPLLSTFGCCSGITSAATVAVTQSQSQNSIITTLVLSTGIIGAYAVNVRSENTNDGLPFETGSLSKHQPPTTAPSISKAQGLDQGRIAAGRRGRYWGWSRNWCYLVSGWHFLSYTQDTGKVSGAETTLRGYALSSSVFHMEKLGA